MQKKKNALVYGKQGMIHLVLLTVSLVIAFPFVWMVTNSLKTKDEIWATPPQLFPAKMQWVNYADALKDGLFVKYMWNSAYTALLITGIVLISSAMFAYAITNVRFRGRHALFLIVMVTYMMPSATTQIPSYVILAKMHLIDSHFGYILSMVASVFSIFYFRQMFLQISPFITEAARVDGASHFTILWRIVAPMSVSSFVTLGVLSFVGCYNAYVWPSLILKSKSNYLVSMGLNLFFSTDGAYGMKWGAIMASCCCAILPLLIIFFVGEKYIISGISGDSGVKG